jgi:NADH:ubiquinone oxidoreductase subunit E
VVALVSIKVCVGSSCYLKGAHKVVECLQDAICKAGIAEQVELSCVFCLGHCQNGPNIQINDELISGVTPQRAKELIEEVILPQVRGD